MMRILLSTIGSRGDVQPLVAISLTLQALDQEVRLCVPPDFRDWIESLGMFVTSIALQLALQPDMAARAQSIATTVWRDGVQTAAQHLMTTGL